VLVLRQSLECCARCFRFTRMRQHHRCPHRREAAVMTEWRLIRRFVRKRKLPPAKFADHCD
jgi:hypothetical protein